MYFTRELARDKGLASFLPSNGGAESRVVIVPSIKKDVDKHVVSRYNFYNINVLILENIFYLH